MNLLAFAQRCLEAPESSIQVLEEDSMGLTEIDKQVPA